MNSHSWCGHNNRINQVTNQSQREFADALALGVARPYRFTQPYPLEIHAIFSNKTESNFLLCPFCGNNVQAFWQFDVYEIWPSGATSDVGMLFALEFFWYAQLLQVCPG